MTAPTIPTHNTAVEAQFLAPPNNQGAGVQEDQAPRLQQTDVSELVLEARCAMAMAKVMGPLDFRRAFDYCCAARRWAHRAGVASISSAPMPLQFEHSPTLAGAWHAGHAVRLSSSPKAPRLHTVR